LLHDTLILDAKSASGRQSDVSKLQSIGVKKSSQLTLLEDESRLVSLEESIPAVGFFDRNAPPSTK
jgi:hypothetical protein